MKRKQMAYLLCFCLVGLCAVGCNQAGEMETLQYEVVKHETGDFMVEFRIEQAEEGIFLLDVMKQAQTKAEITLEVDATEMVTAIDGRANDVDFDPCWMLYTTDEEMSNTQWGTVTLNGVTLGSAVVGAATLEIVEGECYVWVYQTF